VRWRLVDLVQRLRDKFGLSGSRQTLGRELRAIGLRKRGHHQPDQANEQNSSYRPPPPPIWHLDLLRLFSCDLRIMAKIQSDQIAELPRGAEVADLTMSFCLTTSQRMLNVVPSQPYRTYRSAGKRSRPAAVRRSRPIPI
jgi:hypothetical protein